MSVLSQAIALAFFGKSSPPAAPGQVLFSGSLTSDVNTLWTCPPGVFSVSVCCISAGGRYVTGVCTGAGGNLAYKNSIPVAPGNTYAVFIAKPGGDTTTPGTDGGVGTYFQQVSVVHAPSVGYTSYGGTLTGDGGGRGGSGRNWNSVTGAGGGGAAGYSGVGSDGGVSGETTATGTAGGGSGGVSGHSGGGVGIVGQYTPGAGSTSRGRGGSGGQDSNLSTYNGGNFGGGMGETAAQPGVGGLRIMWGGGRSYPLNAFDM